MTTEFSFPVSLRHLLAVAQLASTDETRYVLNGVLVEVHEGNVLLVATDGRALGALNLGAVGPADVAAVRLIIPRELIERAEKVFGLYGDGRRGTVVTIEKNVAGEVTIASGDYQLRGGSIDGNFPNWRFVFPRTEPGTILANLNPHYLQRFARISELMSEGHSPEPVCLRGYNHADQDAPFTIQFPGVDFVAVLMPIRSDSVPKAIGKLPDWLGLPSAQ